MTATVHLSIEALDALVFKALITQGLSTPQARATTRVIVAGQRDACQSHGLYRVLTAAATLRDPQLAPSAAPEVLQSAPSVVSIDARHGFSSLACEIGSDLLVEKARRQGIAALAIRNAFHFTALWPEVEAIAEQGLVAIAMTISCAWVAPAGGRVPVLGTNPFAFAWPREGNHPYVFDFATSVAARGDIELHRRSGTPLPEGWGVDATGKTSTDATEILDRGAMTVFGGHKGSALSTMIELLAGPLIGELTSLETVKATRVVGGAPCHGELILAMDPRHFGLGDIASDQGRAEAMFAAITDQGARMPSQRRFEARAKSLVDGVEVPAGLHSEVLRLCEAPLSSATPR